MTRFVGVVLDVDSACQRFTARLCDRPGRTELADFVFDAVTESERDLIEPGAVFVFGRWSSRRRSRLRFCRAPRPRKQLDAAKAEARRLSYLFRDDP